MRNKEWRYEGAVYTNTRNLTAGDKLVKAVRQLEKAVSVYSGTVNILPSFSSNSTDFKLFMSGGYKDSPITCAGCRVVFSPIPITETSFYGNSAHAGLYVEQSKQTMLGERRAANVHPNRNTQGWVEFFFCTTDCADAFVPAIVRFTKRKRDQWQQFIQAKKMLKQARTLVRESLRP